MFDLIKFQVLITNSLFLPSEQFSLEQGDYEAFTKKSTQQQSQSFSLLIQCVVEDDLEGSSLVAITKCI